MALNGNTKGSIAPSLLVGQELNSIRKLVRVSILYKARLTFIKRFLYCNSESFKVVRLGIMLKRKDFPRPATISKSMGHLKQKTLT